MVEIAVLDKGYGGLLKQHLDPNFEQLIGFHSGSWTGPQVHYSTIKKEVLSIANNM